MTRYLKWIKGLAERATPGEWIAGKPQPEIPANHNNLPFVCALRNTHPAVVRALEAAQGLLEVSPCQNGCASDDMTCASRRMEVAIRELDALVPEGVGGDGCSACTPERKCPDHGASLIDFGLGD